MTDVASYDYHLPPELIAQEPLLQRADARLLVVDRRTGTLAHRYVRDLPELLDAGDTLVLNDTRVTPARLIGRRSETGGRWEGLWLSETETGAWRLLAKTRGRIQPGEAVTLIDRQGRDAFELALLRREEEGGVWEAMPLVPGSAFELLHRVGRVPLPPYIRHGEAEPADEERYQTVYATHEGSVAAPTAGLHLTESLLQRLQTAGVAQARVTLHVGVGTFRPMQVEQVEDHVMHAEWGELDGRNCGLLTTRRAAGGRIVAVGTTALRVLESAALEGELHPWRGETRLFVRPGHVFRAVDALLTNFHLPRSTLLVLVRTFGGDALLRQAYDEAIAERYRFFSYGDAMLIL